MNKQILEDYIDVCEFIRESEARIRRLESKKRVVMDKVHGSNPDFPYEERSFSLVGTDETPKDAYELSMEKKLLEEVVRVWIGHLIQLQQRTGLGWSMWCWILWEKSTF